MRLESQGMRMEDYLKMMGMTPEMMRASARPSALRQLQTELALEAVAKAEGIETTDEEYEAEVAKLAEQYNFTAEQVKAAVSAEDLKRELALKKANELVVSKAKAGKAKKSSKKEEGAEKKPAAKKTTTKKASAKKEEKAEDAEQEKPKRTTRKKKTEEQDAQ